MVTFILNNEQVSTDRPSGSPLLDFIRYDMGLTGTKTGCREGDCGACTVLVGTLEGDTVIYRSAVSCLMPLGNAHGKHIVTIEGINTGHLSHVQHAMVDNNAIQCGFCTPGIVMSLTGESLSGEKTTRESAIDSVSGNICRCTGYKSIERAAEAIAAALNEKDVSAPLRWLVEQKQLPEYFLTIPERLSVIREATNANGGPRVSGGTRISGGTDLMIQKADRLAESEIVTFHNRRDLKGIKVENGRCIIGAGATFTDIGQSDIFRKYLPDITTAIRLIASEPVRNMATVGGNIVNASPIGDFSVILLALNADVTIDGGAQVRTIPLRNLFLEYKKLDLSDGEYIRNVSFSYLAEPPLFSFEKVSRRTHLDIASVNSAITLRMNGDIISECHMSAGGVSPVPLYLKGTCAFLTGRPVNAQTVQEAGKLIQEEIFPISDARGSEKYKRLLLRQLFLAHIMKLFPGMMNLITEQL
ncbi:MAG: FAD binding domain-containing protein [Bacteroidales bacterium]|jgi:xanthine dehydrogenase small subunit|nr:FAD binding domain-containing protein [Bacteroidales bacterium]